MLFATLTLDDVVVSVYICLLMYICLLVFLVLFPFFFFFFKQKTAYEMRISDWSSDVCSSDLATCTSRSPPPSCATRSAPRWSSIRLCGRSRSACSTTPSGAACCQPDPASVPGRPVHHLLQFLAVEEARQVLDEQPGDDAVALGVRAADMRQHHDALDLPERVFRRPRP